MIEYVPDNSPILDVKKSGATGIIYIKVPYKLVCSKCGKFIKDDECSGEVHHADGEYCEYCRGVNYV